MKVSLLGSFSGGMGGMKFKDYSLKLKLGLLFTMFFLLYTISFLIQSYYINNQNNMGKLINKAGQQRMVLQKIVNDTLLVNDGNEFQKSELMKSALQYDQTLRWLLQENHVSSASQHLIKLFPLWEDYHDDIQSILRAEDSESLQKSSHSILIKSHFLLKETDYLVTLLETYAQQSIDQLQRISQLILFSNITVVIFAFWISSKEIIHPIVEVFHNINRIAAGQLNLDFMSVHRKDEIGKLKTSVNRMLTSLKQIEQTGFIQQAFLPEELMDKKFSVKRFYHASEYVSGDLFNYIWDPKMNTIKGYLFDIMGHGLITAIQTSSLRVLFEQALYKEGNPSEKMAWVNKEAIKYFTEDTFAAAFYFEFHFNCHMLVLSAGGMNQYVNIRNGQNSIRKVEGCFIGLANELEFEDYTEVFQSGDSFIFMSDGLSDHLFSWLSSDPSDISTIHEKLVTFATTHKNHDDMSAIFFEIK